MTCLSVGSLTVYGPWTCRSALRLEFWTAWGPVNCGPGGLDLVNMRHILTEAVTMVHGIKQSSNTEDAFHSSSAP